MLPESNSPLYIWGYPYKGFSVTLSQKLMTRALVLFFSSLAFASLVVINVEAAKNVESETDDLTAMLAFVSTWSTDQDYPMCNDSSWTAATPVCRWAGVKCDASNTTVVGFTWTNHGCGGVYHLSLLPKKIRHLDLSYSMFSGSVHCTFSGAPETLEYLNLRSATCRTGEIMLAMLPSSLTYVDLSSLWNGNFIASQIPPKAQSVYLEGWGGSIGGAAMRSLPKSLLYLDLSSNYASAVTGTPDLTSLPPSLQFLNLAGTGICGTFNTGVDTCSVLVELPSQCNCTFATGAARCPAC